MKSSIRGGSRVTLPERCLLLVRHGRSSHSHRGRIDADGFADWRRRYEAAGIRADERPPDRLLRLAADASIVVASDAPRAFESAELLAPGKVTASLLLRELELSAPRLGGVRMPLPFWALVIGAGNSLNACRSTYPSQAEAERIVAAAEWIQGVSNRNSCVIAVTHGAFRQLLARRLVRSGWKIAGGRASVSHWSSWRLVPLEGVRSGR